MFEEVSVADMPIDDDTHCLLLLEPCIEQGKGQFLDGVIRELEAFVEDRWNDQFHMVFHSSGIDSRIVSKIIHRLYKKNGPEWLGEVLFVCFGPECDEFMKIMEYEGWRRDQYFPCQNMLGACLYFEDAHNWLNGPCQNALGLAVLEQIAVDISLAPPEYQLWSGYGANELFVAASGRGSLEARMRKEYRSEASVGRYRRRALYPFRAHNVLCHVATSECRMGGSLRTAVLRRLDPKLLEFENVQWRNAMLVPAKLRAISIKSYEGSWYAENIKPLHIENTTWRVMVRQWWRDWSAAAICQHLLREGYELKCAS
jgi:hypothetical protein